MRVTNAYISFNTQDGINLSIAKIVQKAPTINFSKSDLQLGLSMGSTNDISPALAYLNDFHAYDGDQGYTSDDDGAPEGGSYTPPVAPVKTID